MICHRKGIKEYLINYDTIWTMMTKHFPTISSERKGQKFFVARAGLCRVSHLWFRSGIGKFPLKIPISSPPGKKISSGQVKKYPLQRWVGLLFTAGQKYARVGSGSISTAKAINICVSL